MTARLPLLLATTMVALCAPAAAGAAEALDLSPAGASGKFPKRSWVLAAPEGTRIEPAAVHVTENGRPVRSLRVESAGEARATLVLLVDVSGSMRGRPIENAVAAARSFARRRRPSQRLGLVLFNRTPRVALRPTTDGNAIARALAAVPKLGPGTNINDGVQAALSLLRGRGDENRSVVVLSDGNDTGSRATHGQVVAAARAQQARIFTVGLSSRSLEPTALRRLASETGGAFAATRTPEALREIFSALGARLANEVVIAYESLQPGGREVRVGVDVDGGGADASVTYLTPEPSLPAVRRRQRADDFWLSSTGVALVVVVCAGLLALSAGLVLRRPRKSLADRMTAFVQPTDDRGSVQARPSASGPLSARLEDRVSSALSGRGRWARLEQEIEVAGIDRPPAQIVTSTVLGTLVAVALAGLVAGPLALLGLAVPAAVWFWVRRAAGKQRALFEDQLADSLQVLASALRAGHSFTGALATVVEGADEPACTEFARVRTDEQLGVPIEECINRMAERMRNRDLRQVAVVAALQQETGGNTAEVVDRVVENVRERGEIRRLVRTLTGQGRLAHAVVTALPIGLAVYISVTSPDHIAALVDTAPGRLMIVLAAFGTVTGSYVIKRIVDIEV